MEDIETVRKMHCITMSSSNAFLTGGLQEDGEIFALQPR